MTPGTPYAPAILHIIILLYLESYAIFLDYSNNLSDIFYSYCSSLGFESDTFNSYYSIGLGLSEDFIEEDVFEADDYYLG